MYNYAPKVYVTHWFMDMSALSNASYMCVCLGKLSERLWFFFSEKEPDFKGT